MNNWENIKEIFWKAIRLSPEERETFLEEACNNNPQMKEEVESLITSYFNSGNFLEAPILQLEEPVADDYLIGMIIGKYRIEEKIGDGGMAVVYSALRMDGQFKRRVAIKLIKRGMDTDEIIRRFKIEQQTLAELDHPNIARIIDGGTTDYGTPYFVMELIEGESIDKYCRDNKLTTQQILLLFQKVCSAVQYAHHNLVVHRDIKPGNIFVTKDGTPKLLDFGIAKLLNNSNDQTNLTKTGLKVMTLEYASPEQFKGQHITTSTDIYSLGVVMYELLTGQFPYTFKNILPYEIERVICNIDPLKPSSAITKGDAKTGNDLDSIIINPDSQPGDIKKVRKNLSGDIDNIVLKAMQKEPGMRYPTVEQFSEDIRRHLSGLPILARKNSLGYRSKKFFVRHRTATISATVILCIIVASIIGAIYQAKIAANERDKAQIETVKVNKINSLLQNMLSSADPYVTGKDVKVVDILDNTAKGLDKELKNQPEINASLKTTIGITYQNLGIFDKAEWQLDKALEIRKSIFGENNDETASSYKNLASIYYSEGRFDEAKILYEKSIKIHKKFPKPKNIALADALNEYAELNLELGKYDTAIQYFNEAYLIYREFGENNYNFSAVTNNLAMAFDYKGELDSAEYLYRKALKISYNLTGNRDLQIAHESNNLAFILHEKGDFQGAIELYRKSLEIRVKNLGENNSEVGLALCNLGGELFYTGAYAESLEKINEALKVWKKTLPADHPYFAKVYFWLGKLYNSRNIPSKAQDYLLKSLDIQKRKQPGHTYYIAQTNCELARSYILQKNYKKAGLILPRNFEILEKDLGEYNIETTLAAKLLAELYQKLRGQNGAK